MDIKGPVKSERIKVKGKFLFNGEDKFFIKGVTYGTFCPNENGMQFPTTATIEKDFGYMALKGINCVRTYTVPPQALLDIALEYNMKVMVGLPWEQHITFLDDETIHSGIISRIRTEVKRCNAHPSILCYTIGNEIPAGIVRWYGKKRIEAFLKKIYRTVKETDPEALVTYVNYPTTEYLDLSFLDFDCFNVYLETPEKLGSYISRLQNLCGDKPLVLAEIGLDSRRNGEEKQAAVLKWQIETIFAKGCAGMFVFAWTDEWWRGGYNIEDWDFGLITRERMPKPALAAMSNAFESIPVPLQDDFPFISVIVCSYNGSATIRECLSEILKLDYPAFEVIIVDDGSTDGLPEIVKEFPVKLISTPNKGLSHARNTGMYEARGEIIAYIDDDAFPDPHWLKYLAYAYNNSDHACIGGPNIAPDDDGIIATAVANAPGGPVHVLLSDEIAEHVPGCNMSFRRQALKKIGGFDFIFTNAGDDVDVCWRIQQSGKTVGFHPSAMVWHRRRNSIKAYWKQQKGYGKAEALLEAKWPEKYNSFGHLNWAGRIYGNGFTLPINFKKERIFQGTWGTSAFQSVYQPATGLLSAIPLMPEWYLLTMLWAIIGLFGIIWQPLLWAWLPFIVSAGIIVVQAVISATKNTAPHLRQKGSMKLKILIVVLHIIQPVARLYGRIKNGLTPWRFRGVGISLKFLFSFGRKTFTYWSEEWHAPEEWLTSIESQLTLLKTRVKRGGDYDHWDLQLQNGIFSKCRSMLVIEEHGAGKQYLRFKVWNHYPTNAFIITVSLLPTVIFSIISKEWFITIFFGVFLLLYIARLLTERANSTRSMCLAFIRMHSKKDILHEKQVIKEKIKSIALHTDSLQNNGHFNNIEEVNGDIAAGINVRVDKS